MSTTWKCGDEKEKNIIVMTVYGMQQLCRVILWYRTSLSPVLVHLLQITAEAETKHAV